MKLVIVNGFHRTGSTLAYNIVQEIFARSHIPYKSNPGAGTAEVIQLIGEQAQKDHWLVVKTHRWLPTGLEPEWIKSVFTMRNPYDTAASLMRKPDGHLTEAQVIEELIRQRFGNAYMQTVKTALVLKYGHFYENISYLLTEIENYLNLRLSVVDREEVITKYQVARVKGRCDAIAEACDWSTSFRRGHITETLGKPGAYKDVLSEDMIYKIKAFVLMEKMV